MKQPLVRTTISYPVPVRRRFALSLVAAVIGLAVLIAWLGAGGRQDAQASNEVITVTPRTFTATVVAVGAVKPQIGAEVRVGSRVSGRVWRLRANIGDRVEKGTVLAELETAELDALRAQRSAELALARARRAALDTLAPDQEARAVAAVRRSEAEATLASEELQRQQTLLEKGVAPRATADAARDRHAVSQADLESARRASDLVRTENVEQRKQADAEIERARAALESASVDRSFTVLRAPISGVVASVSTQEGETVAAGLSAPTFVTIVDLDRLQLNAYVDEVDIGKITAGQSVTFTVDAFPARDFKGQVGAIYPSATIQDNVVKYIVAIDIADTYGGLLRPEMTASVRIQLEERTALAVPTRAIRREAGRSVVYVVNGEESAARFVRVGWRDGPWTEIAHGVAAGERILVDAPTSTEDNTP
jgi:multidrug efflux pump subunit AcrA (membrane-fusion protein)